MSNTLYRVIQRVKGRIIPTVLNKTANYTVKADEALYGTVVSNIGATGEVIFSLPAAVPGMRVNAIVQSPQLLTLDPVDGDIIHGIAGVAQTEDVAIKANAVGETVQLVCLVTGKWYVAAYTGTWTVTAA
jgi:hypothetical protein